MQVGNTDAMRSHLLADHPYANALNHAFRMAQIYNNRLVICVFREEFYGVTT